jgi:hypothetical protein
MSWVSKQRTTKRELANMSGQPFLTLEWINSGETHNIIFDPSMIGKEPYGKSIFQLSYQPKNENLQISNEPK